MEPTKLHDMEYFSCDRINKDVNNFGGWLVVPSMRLLWPFWLVGCKTNELCCVVYAGCVVCRCSDGCH